MSEALISDAELSPRGPTEVLRSGRGSTPYRPANASALLSLPVVRPGQLWYVQFSSTEPPLAPLEYRALTTANVVIYDGALAPIVAASLPIGGYAELAASHDQAAERCLRFARDGWSVARLVDPRNGWIDGLRQLSERLLRVPATAALPVSIIVSAGVRYKNIETELSKLGDVAERLGFDQPIATTVIVEGIEAGTAPRFVVASANGLAG
jgi:hypothetical protein